MLLPVLVLDRLGLDLFGLPAGDGVVVADDAALRPELGLEDGPHEVVRFGEEVEADDRRLGDVGLGGVHADELDQAFDAGGLGVALRFLDHGLVDVDPHAAGPVAAGGRDNDAAVAAADVVEDVLVRDLGQLEHAVDDRLGRRDPRGEVDGVGPAVGPEEEVDRLALVVAEGVGAARVERIDGVLLPRGELDHEGARGLEAVDGAGGDLPVLGGLGLSGRIDPVGDGPVGDVAEGRFLEMERLCRGGRGGGRLRLAAGAGRSGQREEDQGEHRGVLISLSHNPVIISESILTVKTARPGR